MPNTGSKALVPEAPEERLSTVAFNVACRVMLGGGLIPYGYPSTSFFEKSLN